MEVSPTNEIDLEILKVNAFNIIIALNLKLFIFVNLKGEMKHVFENLKKCKTAFTKNQLKLKDFDFKTEMTDLLLSTPVVYN
jgi:hypothetical protein